ncbi:MAG: AMP-binding protein [Labilithrix sp.]|nr:AMP-binding protein [Labilithrix sp.]
MVLTSRSPSPTIPDLSLAAYFRRAVAPFASQTALIDGPSGRSYTYQQLLDLSASVAHALAARGVGRGDRVAFVCPNVPEVALAYHGTIAVGAVAMMLNPLSTPGELEKYFGSGRPKLVVTVPPFVEAIRAAAPSLPIVVIGEVPGCEPLAALLGGPKTPPEIDVSADDLAVMPYSSGTTGFPKGVMLTQRNMIAQCRSLDAMKEADVVIAGSNVLAVLPFFHIYGIMAFLTFGLTRGATIITMPRFDMPTFLELARKHEVPLLHVVPPILLGLAKHPGELDLPKLKYALVGAAPLGEGLAEEFTKRTGALVYQVYGMTEVTGASHLGTRVPERNKPGSIGGLVAGVEARVVGVESGEDVAPGEPGEVWVRGPIVMKGYFDEPEATKATVDAEGWLHTGDVGYVDRDGDFFLVDRVKELIKYKGMQVAPAELEAVLLRHEAVADAAVFPRPDPEAGEIPVAAVVVKGGKTVSEDALMAFVQERVSPQKRIRAVVFLDQIPKSASGKILRRLLVAR